jgi:hypothetical protein
LTDRSIMFGNERFGMIWFCTVSLCFCLLLWKTPFAPLLFVSPQTHEVNWWMWWKLACIVSQCFVIVCGRRLSSPIRLASDTRRHEGQKNVRRSGKSWKYLWENRFCVLCAGRPFPVRRIIKEERRLNYWLMDLVFGNERFGMIWFCTVSLCFCLLLWKTPFAPLLFVSHSRKFDR